MVKSETSKSVSRSAISLAERRDIFGSSDESDDPSAIWGRSLESGRGGGLGHSNDVDGDAVMLDDQDDRDGHGFSIYSYTMQEAKDCGILCVAPKKIAWLPLQRVLDLILGTVRDQIE